MEGEIKKKKERKNNNKKARAKNNCGAEPEHEPQKWVLKWDFWSAVLHRRARHTESTHTHTHTHTHSLSNNWLYLTSSLTFSSVGTLCALQNELSHQALLWKEGGSSGAACRWGYHAGADVQVGSTPRHLGGPGTLKHAACKMLIVCSRQIRALFSSKQNWWSEAAFTSAVLQKCLVSCRFVHQSSFIHLKQHDVSFIVVIFVFLTAVLHSETAGGTTQHKKPIYKFKKYIFTCKNHILTHLNWFTGL